MPLVEVSGKAFRLAPAQIGATALKTGITAGLTLIVIVVLTAHCPLAGVKVYVVVAVLFNAGDQVPLIPLLEISGKGFKLPPVQIAGTGVKLGLRTGLTAIVIVAVLAHCPLAGVNV